MSSVMPSYLKYNLSCEDIYLHVKEYMVKDDFRAKAA